MGHTPASSLRITVGGDLLVRGTYQASLRPVHGSPAVCLRGYRLAENGAGRDCERSSAPSPAPGRTTSSRSFLTMSSLLQKLPAMQIFTVSADDLSQDLTSQRNLGPVPSLLPLPFGASMGLRLRCCNPCIPPESVLSWVPAPRLHGPRSWMQKHGCWPCLTGCLNGSCLLFVL